MSRAIYQAAMITTVLTPHEHPQGRPLRRPSPLPSHLRAVLRSHSWRSYSIPPSIVRTWPVTYDAEVSSHR